MKNGTLKAFKVMSTAALTSLIFTSFSVFAENNDVSFLTNPTDEIAEQGTPIVVQRNTDTNQENSLYKDTQKEDTQNEDAQINNYKPDELVHLIVQVDEPSENEVTAQNKQALFTEKQDSVIDQLTKEKKSKSNDTMKVKHRYFEGFNGFSVETEYKNIKDIQSMPGVTHVSVARTYKENMAASKELVQAQKVWEQYGYKGEGLVVGVVDSGIDYTHKDMKLSDDAKAKERWTHDKMNQKMAQTDVNEIWYSDKVPTGYDWADNDTDVIPGPKGSPHGTHVSGTIGANGDETKDGVVGIAPGVQLLAEKVFSDNASGAYEDDIIAGIEHAVTMGADVINMSLGVDSGYVDEDYDPIQKAIREATEQGTLVVVAAGNSAYSTQNLLVPSTLRPYAEDPDIGTVGSPGVSPFALSVASYENTKMHVYALGDYNGLSVPFRDQTQFAPSYNFKVSNNLIPDQSYDMVYVGEGKSATNYPKGKTGYIAVVKLLNQYSTVSSIQFTAKEKAGAVALKEIGQNTSFKLNMEAFDAPKGKNNSADIEYNVYVDLLKDRTETKEFDFNGDGQTEPRDYLSLTSERISGATVTVNDNTVSEKTGTLVKIKPGQTKMLTVNVSLPDSLKKNSFVEGFVRLVPVEKDQVKTVSLSIPYMGFYGKWDELRNIDSPAWENDSFAGHTALWDDMTEGGAPLGYTGKGFKLNHIAYSPNYLNNGIYAGFTALRNLEKVESSIEDKDGNLIKYLGNFSEYTGTGQPWKFSKNIMSYGVYNYDGYKWDMKDPSTGQYVPDGTYQYVLKTTLDYPNARPQIVKMPMIVDSIDPKISDIKVTPKNGKYEVSWNAEDNASDYNSAVIYVNGVSYTPSLEAKSQIVNTEPKSIVILGIDYAGNVSWTTWGDPSYIKYTMAIQTWNVSPTVGVNQNKPAKINGYAYNRGDWTINVKNSSGQIVETSYLKNEHTLHANWVPDKNLPNGTYSITLDLVTKDGFKVTSTPKTVTVVQ